MMLMLVQELSERLGNATCPTHAHFSLVLKCQQAKFPLLVANQLM